MVGFTHIVSSVLLALFVSQVAHASCQDTAQLLNGSGRLNVQVAELKNKVEQVAFGTPAAAALTKLRAAAEHFYDVVYLDRHSCRHIERRFGEVDAAGQEVVATVEAQGLTADDDISARLVDVRFGLYNVGLLVDQL